jgi:hypothetical protein
MAETSSGMNCWWLSDHKSAPVSPSFQPEKLLVCVRIYQQKALFRPIASGFFNFFATFSLFHNTLKASKFNQIKVCVDSEANYSGFLRFSDLFYSVH